MKFIKLIQALAIIFALNACSSAKPVVESTKFDARGTLDQSLNLAANYTSVAGYSSNQTAESRLYDKFGLANSYAYTAKNIAMERVAGGSEKGTPIKVGVIEPLHGSGKIPINHTSIVDSMAGSYLYDSNGNITSTALASVSSTTRNVENDASGDHGLGVMSLIAGKATTVLKSWDVASNKTSRLDAKMHGVAYNSQLIYVGGTGLGTTGAIPSVINFMHNNGARVVNMSFGGASYNASDAAAFATITQNKSIIMVAASGNDREKLNSEYPARYANGSNANASNLGALIIAAGSNYNNSEYSGLSNGCSGSIFCLAAPAILSDGTNYATVATTAYVKSGTNAGTYRPMYDDVANSYYLQNLSDYSAAGKIYAGTIYNDIIASATREQILVSAAGTSYSAPIISGAAANILAAFPRINGRDAAKMMLVWAKPAADTSRTQGHYDENKLSVFVGWGYLDLAKTIEEINKSKFGYTNSNTGGMLPPLSVQNTAISASPLIAGSVGVIGASLANSIFTDSMGNSFTQGLDYKTYTQNGQGGLTNSYTQNTNYMSGGAFGEQFSSFYSSFFSSAGVNNGAGYLSLPSGTSLGFSVNNQYYNQGSALNINTNPLVKGFVSSNTNSQNPYAGTTNLNLAQNVGKANFAFASGFGAGANFGADNKVELASSAMGNQSNALSFLRLASLQSQGRVYNAGYAINKKTSVSFVSGQFRPFNTQMLSEFAGMNFNRNVSQLTLQHNKEKSIYSITMGALSENGAFLSTFTNGAFLINGANTSYVEANISQNIAKGFSLNLSSTIGSTSVKTIGGSAFSSFSPLTTSSHAIELVKNGVFSGFGSSKVSDSLTIAVKMPLAVISGSAVMFNGNSYQNVSLVQNARQRDLELSYKLKSLANPSNAIYFSVVHSQNFVNLAGLKNNYALFSYKKMVG